MVFDHACGFQFSNQCMTDEVEKVINEISLMRESAIELCNTRDKQKSIHGRSDLSE